MQRLDCRGISCPKPVLRAKDVIQAYPDDAVEVVVDNKAARENVSRFFMSQGWEASVAEHGAEFVVTAVPGACAVEFGASTQSEPEEQKILVLLPSDVIGQGNDELGAGLMKNFLSTLKEMGGELWRIVLVNGGVRLAVEGSEHLSELQKLAREGVDILVCGTCLDFYGLLDKKAIGVTTNMLDIVTSCQLATKVVRF